MATTMPPVARLTQKSAGRGTLSAIDAPTLLTVPAAGGPARSHSEREEIGKALRDRVQRAAHGAWKRPRIGDDPIEILRASEPSRVPELLPIRYGRMLQSPFTFYRGSAAVMAADLATTPVTGSRVQACGDCHLMNFGGFATPERNVIFDINDFRRDPAGALGMGCQAPCCLLRARRPVDRDFRCAGASMRRWLARVAIAKRLRDFAEMHPIRGLVRAHHRGGSLGSRPEACPKLR